MKTSNFAAFFAVVTILLFAQNTSAQKVESRKYHCANGKNCTLAPNGLTKASRGVDQLHRQPERSLVRNGTKYKHNVPGGCTSFACRNNRSGRTNDQTAASSVVTVAPALKMIFRQGG